MIKFLNKRRKEREFLTAVKDYIDAKVKYILETEGFYKESMVNRFLYARSLKLFSKYADLKIAREEQIDWAEYQDLLKFLDSSAERFATLVKNNEVNLEKIEALTREGYASPHFIDPRIEKLIFYMLNKKLK